MQGRPIRLERQPMELLILLVERRGRLVSGGDIAERLWGKDVFADVETSVNLVYAGLGDRARAFEWLEKAYSAHDVHLVFLPVDPRWAAYRADPRFVDLVARCGFTRETTQ